VLPSFLKTSTSPVTTATAVTTAPVITEERSVGWSPPSPRLVSPERFQ
jgi:hypothetical protein